VGDDGPVPCRGSEQQPDRRQEAAPPAIARDLQAEDERPEEQLNDELFVKLEDDTIYAAFRYSWERMTEDEDVYLYP
jgi:hypothetical protein